VGVDSFGQGYGREELAAAIPAIFFAPGFFRKVFDNFEQENGHEKLVVAG
jgi:hypothetical protein